MRHDHWTNGVREPRNWSCECECGRAKASAAMSCAACRRLDGDPRSFEFVQALRSLGGTATIDALVVEMGQSRGTVATRAHRLLRSGRLVRRIVPAYSAANDEALFVLVTPRGG